jgi:hypothetical protein
VVFGERQLRYLIGEYVAHYHGERPLQRLGNVPPGAESPTGVPPDPEGAIVCRERLGELLKHSHRAA